MQWDDVLTAMAVGGLVFLVALIGLAVTLMSRSARQAVNAVAARYQGEVVAYRKRGAHLRCELRGRHADRAFTFRWGAAALDDAPAPTASLTVEPHRSIDPHWTADAPQEPAIQHTLEALGEQVPVRVAASPEGVRWQVPLSDLPRSGGLLLGSVEQLCGLIETMTLLTLELEGALPEHP